MEVTRIFDLLDRYQQQFHSKDDVLAGKEDGVWKKYDLATYRKTADLISYALMALGVQKDDKIATISNNRPEWNFLDMGVSQIGAIHVPIYPTISKEDYQYILNHAEVKFLFVASKDLYRKIEHILPEIEKLEAVYSFSHIEGVTHLDGLLETGRQHINPALLQERKNAVDLHDVVTLIYTSGTTGYPKGVMLSHDNLLSNVKAVFHIFPVDEYSRGLSYLPLCHVYERMVNYVMQYKGVSIYYAENMATIVDNIQEIRPHIMTTVPRLLEKVYDKILSRGRNLSGLKKQIFFWSVRLGLKYEFDKPMRLFYHLQLKLANKLVFAKWREALGGEMRVIVSGGAALQSRLASVFNAANIPVLEGYGLTESSPVIAVNTFIKGQRKIGTVGPPVKNLKVRISEAGEILVKGPSVMKGYFKEEQMTKETVVDGWLHTGDMGLLDKDGMLRITGRLKEIFKTSMGKYISPVLIENKFKESPFIDQIMVVGENQKFAAALIVPDFEYVRGWCALHGIEFTTNDALKDNEAFKKRMRQEVAEYNKLLGDTERVKKFGIIDHEWTIDSGEITANLKVKRQYIHAKYKHTIEGLFDV